MRTSDAIENEIKALKALNPVGPFKQKTTTAIALSVDELGPGLDDTAEEFWSELTADQRDIVFRTRRWKEGDSDDKPSEGWGGLVARIAELEAGTAAMREAMLYVVEQGWIEHNPDCPEDDTCDCTGATLIKKAFKNNSGQTILDERDCLRKRIAELEKSNEPEAEPITCSEEDGCPIENGVLKREWRLLRQRIAELEQVVKSPLIKTDQLELDVLRQRIVELEKERDSLLFWKENATSLQHDLEEANEAHSVLLDRVSELEKEGARLVEFHKTDMRVTNESADYHMKECHKLRQQVAELEKERDDAWRKGMEDAAQIAQHGGCTSADGDNHGKRCLCGIGDVILAARDKGPA